MFGKGVQENPPAGVTGASPGFPPFPKRWVEDALDSWCAKVGRNPHEIERSIFLPGSVSISQLEAYVQVGATHILVEVDPPWNFDFVRTVLRWRKERSS